VTEHDTGSEAGGGESLLVVDDDPFIARLLEIELRAAGYDVRVASDGAQALTTAQERVPDLVLADVMMPNMDGFELTRRLRQDPRTAAVSIIMLTARGLSADKLEGFAIGADDYIVKPFDTPELLARIRGVLRRSRDMRAQSPLTGLPGNVRIEEEINGRVDVGQPFAILYADLDHFKAYNDHYGFMRGDQVIQTTARLVERPARSPPATRSSATWAATTSSWWSRPRWPRSSRRRSSSGSTRAWPPSTTTRTGHGATSR
jgi:PleD family two-component response regulator